jgi:hypothetical protein
MPSTIYDIRLRYTLDDRAGKGLEDVEKKADKAARATGGLGSILGRLGALAAGGFGIQQAGKHLVGFNANVEDTKLQIGGMLALVRKTDLADEMVRADRVFANLQKRAASLPGTTQEYARFAGMITQPIIDAGLGMRDLEDLTVNAVVAAKSLGEQAEVAARDISQVLRGQFHSTDPFAGKVLGSIGYKGEDGRKRFNELSAQERASELRRALMQKQWAQLAAAQGATFNGMLSTFQDTLQQLLGKIGLPLFKAITQELKEWNAWAADNGDKLAAWGKEFGESLVDGFRFVKDALGFLVDHKEDLILIAKMWLAASVGSGIAGMVSGKGGGLLGAFTENISGKGGVRGAAGAVMGNAGAVAAAGMFGWEAGRALDRATGIGAILMEPVARLAGVWDDAADAQDRKFREIARSMERLDKAIAARSEAAKGVTGARGTQAYANIMGAADVRQREAAKLADELRAADKYAAYKAAHPDPMDDYTGGNSYKDKHVVAAREARRAVVQGQLGELGRLDTNAQTAAITTDTLMAAAMASLTESQRRNVDVEQTSQAVMGQMIQSLNELRPNAGGGMSLQLLTYDQVLNIIRAVNGIEAGKPGGPMKAPGKVNVTIQRIEVKSEDPDRFAFSMVEAFRDVAKNPSGAIAAIREG